MDSHLGWVAQVTTCHLRSLLLSCNTIRVTLNFGNIAKSCSFLSLLHHPRARAYGFSHPMPGPLRVHNDFLGLWCLRESFAQLKTFQWEVKHFFQEMGRKIKDLSMSSVWFCSLYYCRNSKVPVEEPDRFVLIYGKEGQSWPQIALKLMCQTRDSQMVFQEGSWLLPLITFAGGCHRFFIQFLGLENTKTMAVPHISGQEQPLSPAGRLIPWVKTLWSCNHHIHIPVLPRQPQHSLRGSGHTWLCLLALKRFLKWPPIYFSQG